MDAKTYLEGHWMKNKVYRRLELPVHQQRLRRCAEAVRGGRTFVDIGCGVGHSTAIMKRFCPGDWTGVDFSKLATAEARRLFPDIRFATIEAREGLRAYGAFDGVVFSEVIEHVENDREWIKTVWGMTIARLVVTTPTVKVKDPGHLRLYTEATLRELFKDIPGVRIERGGRYFYITAAREDSDGR